MILRACGTALATALQGGVTLFKADLFTINVQSGAVYRWCTWDWDLRVGGNVFTGKNPFLSRGKLSLTNTMQVATLPVYVDDQSTTPFLGGSSPSLRVLAHNGYFDGGTMFLQRVYMPDSKTGDTTTYGTIDLFSGDIGKITPMSGARIAFDVRAKNSRLDVMAPRNVYQPGCLHTFCDPGCTLSAATFTQSFAVAVSSSTTQTVIALTPNPSSGPPAFQLQDGTLTMTSGATAGQVRNIISGTTFPGFAVLATPLSVVPVAGDTLTIFQGCNKTLPTCANIFSNAVNFRGFPFIPPPNTTAPGQ